MTDYSTLKTEKDGAVLTITLDRADKLNALNVAMIEDLIGAFDEADADDEVRAVILTGAGKAFCAGADLEGGAKIFEAPEGVDPNAVPRDGGGLVSLRIFDCKKLVIAAINGAAVGVGVTMTLPCDVRLASEDARFGFVFARRGLVPEAASSWFLPRIVGISRAVQWVASGRVFGAPEALQAGLVTEVLPRDELLERARAIATECAESTSAVSIALSRHLLWRMLGADHPMEAHRLDSKCIAFMAKHPDVQEGVMSFLQKRPPEFPMKVSEDMPAFFPWGERSYEE